MRKILHLIDKNDFRYKFLRFRAYYEIEWMNKEQIHAPETHLTAVKSQKKHLSRKKYTLQAK